ncbi:MAG TPA: hypothetical protein VHY56_06705, partial [Candidatus Binataceae bacterium]|nr:hypothetical protein [Candidatus Binataceae bacterium]
CARDDELAALMSGDLTPSLFVNDLEAAAIRRFPAIGQLKNYIKNSGARIATMSGSGGAVFGLFDSMEQADQAADQLRQRDSSLRVFRVRSYRRLFDADK